MTFTISFVSLIILRCRRKALLHIHKGMHTKTQDILIDIYIGFMSKDVTSIVHFLLNVGTFYILDSLPTALFYVWKWNAGAMNSRPWLYSVS